MYSRSPSKKSLHIGKYKQENRKLPINWELCISNNIFPNRPYYFNWITNESKWDFPESTIYRQTPPKIRGHNSRDSHLRGGKQLTNILYHFDKDDFVRWYTYKKDDLNENAYEIYKDLLLYRTNLLSYGVTESQLSILVGATNMYHDYDRFKDSNVYDLYICEEDSTNIERQYDMYTIGYQNIFSNMGLYLVGRVSRIHFDISTAYFCPIEYLTLAEKILMYRGTIVFDLEQHGGPVYFFDRELNIFNPGRKTKEEIENEYNVVIDVDQKVVTSRITDGIYGNGYIAPQIIGIFESTTNKPFRKEPYRGYIEYCREKYPRLRFEPKIYSFLNYTYPVPIKTINQELHIDSYNNIFNFIANNVMTRDERIDYITYKSLSVDKMNELINKVIYSTQLFNDFCTACSLSNRSIYYIKDIIIDEITLNHNYIEGTKI
jgi:hypothetical protein